MKKNLFPIISYLWLIPFFSIQVTAQWVPANQQERKKPELSKVDHQFAARGLRFTENKGQVADLDGRLRPDILFTAQNDGVKLFLTAKGIHYQFRREFKNQSNDISGKEWTTTPIPVEADSTQFYRLEVTLQGANPNPKVIKEG